MAKASSRPNRTAQSGEAQLYRKDLIDFLLENPSNIEDLARSFGLTSREMADEIKHLRKSLRNKPYRIVIFPARCRQCHFSFHRDRLTKPGKCPNCRGTWIQPPTIKVEST